MTRAAIKTADAREIAAIHLGSARLHVLRALSAFNAAHATLENGGFEAEDILVADTLEVLEALPKDLGDAANELRQEVGREIREASCLRCKGTGTAYQDDRPEACDCEAGQREEFERTGGGA